MALIKCTECGHEVSDKASVCPNCGCPVEKESICVECGQPIPHNATECPNCGCPVEKADEKLFRNDSIVADISSKKKGNTNLWLCGVIAVLAIILIGLCFMWFNGGKNGTKLSDEEYSQSVSQLKSILSKAEGMNLGNSKMQQTNVQYDEKKNVIQFTFIQRIFPKSEETPKLLKQLSESSRETRKKSLREIKSLITLMEPLRPIIRDIINYPDGSKCYSYDIPFKELFLDDDKDKTSTKNESSSNWDISSEDELKEKLVGTIWTCRPNGGMWYRLVFSSSYMTLYYAEPQMGRWVGGGENEKWSYTVQKSYTSDTGEKCLSVQFRKPGENFSYGALFFYKGGDVNFSWLRGKFGGKAECKDFQWE